MSKTSSRNKATTRRKAAARGSDIQGEGDYRAARRYRQKVQAFVGSHDIEQAARAAAPRNRREAREMSRAEAVGRSHAHGRGKERMS
jgi:hypothetical protein